VHGIAGVRGERHPDPDRGVAPATKAEGETGRGHQVDAHPEPLPQAPALGRRHRRGRPELRGERAQHERRDGAAVVQRMCTSAHGDGELGAGDRRRQPGQGLHRAADRRGRVGSTGEDTGAAHTVQPGLHPRHVAHQLSRQRERRLPPGRTLRPPGSAVVERVAGDVLEHRLQPSDSGPLGKGRIDGGQAQDERRPRHRAPDERGHGMAFLPRQPAEHHPALGAQPPALQAFAEHLPDPGQGGISEPAGRTAAHPSTTCSRWPSQ
jgi:hypothetical protein